MGVMKRMLALIGGLLFFTATLGGTTSRTALENAESQNKKYPQLVLIIRHAEKPPEEARSVHLSAEGKKRAEVLPQLFQTSKKRPDPFPAPDFIFAAQNSKHSHRSVETVTILAKKLKLPINSNYPDDDFARLAHELFKNPKYASKTILICWHHGTIPQLAKQLKAADAPDTWKGHVFDRVWQITYDTNGKATFLRRPQQLLATDSAK